MRLASIDIGTNSTRLLILEKSATSELHFIEYREEMTKLGAGLSSEKELSDEAMQRVIDVLVEYKAICVNADVQDIQLFATSAARDAANRQAFIQRILQRTQLECQILSGKTEAELSFLGAVSDFQPDGDYVVCDIGGGSTEFIFACEKKITSSFSLNIGSGRLTRAWFSTDPPSLSEIESAQATVKYELASAFPDKSVLQIICTGGTAATLALMHLEQPVSSPLSAHHHILTKLAVSTQIEQMRKLSLDERRQIIGLHAERAGLIIGGAIIMHSIMELFNKPATISLRDLMYGIWIHGETE